jgi:TolB-like protein/DNA-binding winged helix-turn-helix (wHTH) protein/Tfp pilus assembly protein PilF
MRPRAQTVERVSFGCFEVNLVTGEVFRSGRKLRLSSQPAQVLVILVQRAGQLVTREELRLLLWPADTFVDFDHGLNNCITRIRDVLGDSALAPEWIETLPKRGYRFIAPIQTVEQVPETESEQLDEMTAPEDENPSIHQVPQGTRTRAGLTVRLHWLIAVVLTAAGLMAGIAFLIHRSNAQRDRALINIKGIAVLPLANLSGDSGQDYLADGLTDELITQLARNTSVPVISRTSIMRYKNKQTPLPVIASELGVDAVVESRLHRTQSRFTISVNLIVAKTNTHVWARTYEGDMSQMPQVASRIASEIRAELPFPTSESSARPRVQLVSAEAYEQYLKGQLLWNGGQFEAALHHFQQAVALQPDYAAAYGGMAKSLCLMEFAQVLPPAQAYPMATAAAQKALSLDPNIPDAHAALSYLYGQRDWDQERAEQELKTVIAEDPGSFVGHRWYRYMLHATGRHSEALEQARLSLKADPESAFALRLYGDELEDNGKYDEAIPAFSEALEFDPNDGGIRSNLADAYEETGKLESAAIELEKSLRLSGNPDVADQFHKQAGSIGYHRAAEAARHACLLRDLDGLKKKAVRGEYVLPSAYAFTYAGLRDRENTLKWLETSYASDSHVMTQLREHDFDFVRDDPRFKQIWDNIPFLH